MRSTCPRIDTEHTRALARKFELDVDRVEIIHLDCN
jgi:hypothetical protein